MKATEFFTEGLLLEIKHYGGNHVDFAVVIDSDHGYHLWKFDPREQVWLRSIIKNDLAKIFAWLHLQILDNPKIEGEEYG